MKAGSLSLPFDRLLVGCHSYSGLTPASRYYTELFFLWAHNLVSCPLPSLFRPAHLFTVCFLFGQRAAVCALMLV